MFGAILKATNSSFYKGMICGRSIYVKKVMKLLAFIFEQPSYTLVSRLSTIQIDNHVRIVLYILIPSTSMYRPCALRDTSYFF